MSQTETRTHTTITIPKDKSQFGLDVPSIRQICLAGIFNESKNADIAALIHRFHAGSAPTTSAKKMSKHIGWYRSRCRDASTPEYKALQAMLALRGTPAVVEVPAPSLPPVSQVTEPVIDVEALAAQKLAEVEARLAAQGDQAA